jgi:hypothetical protein
VGAGLRTLAPALILQGMGVFSRRVDAMVVALTWKRSVVVEQGHWSSRRTAWKPHGDNVRNLRTVETVEPAIVVDANLTIRGSSVLQPKSDEVMTKNTYYEYEELQWRKLRSFSARGDSAQDVHWPEFALEPEQRVSERREAYHAKFSAGDPASCDVAEYMAELDEAKWRTLRVGRLCRLTVSAFGDEVKQVALARDGRTRALPVQVRPRRTMDGLGQQPQAG